MRIIDIGNVQIRINNTRPIEEIRYRRVSLRRAKEEIEKYLKYRKGKVWIENILDDLKIDPVIVVQVIKKLEKEGKIK